MAYTYIPFQNGGYSQYSPGERPPSRIGPDLYSETTTQPLKSSFPFALLLTAFSLMEHVGRWGFHSTTLSGQLGLLRGIQITNIR